MNPFPTAYKRHKGKLVTHADYLAKVRAEELRKKAKQRKMLVQSRRYELMLSRLIENTPDTYSVTHSMAYPLGLCKPTYAELHAGIPVCCDNEPMRVSRFNLGLWFCRICKRSKGR